MSLSFFRCSHLLQCFSVSTAYLVHFTAPGPYRHGVLETGTGRTSGEASGKVILLLPVNVLFVKLPLGDSFEFNFDAGVVRGNPLDQVNIHHPVVVDVQGG